MNRKQITIYATILGLCAILYGATRQHLPGGMEYEYAHAQESEGEPEGEYIDAMIREVGKPLTWIRYQIPPDALDKHCGPTARIVLQYQEMDADGNELSEWKWKDEKRGVVAGETIYFYNVAVKDWTDGQIYRFRARWINPIGNRSDWVIANWADTEEHCEAWVEFDTELPPTIVPEVEE